MEKLHVSQPQLIEIDGNTYELITGEVGIWRSQPNPADDFGYIKATGLTRDVRFSGSAFRFIEPGVKYPRAGQEIDRTKFTIHPKTKVVLLRPNNPKDRPFTTMVGVKRYYDKALIEISERPTYRVRHIKGRNAGKPIKNSVYETGTAVELQAKFPRLTRNDPLAPVYRSGNIVVRSEWQRKDGDSWVTCNDPRPFPDGATKRIFRITETQKLPDSEFGKAAEGKQVFCAHIGILLECPVESFTGDRFVFEKSSDGIDWTETADPRTETEVLPATAVLAEPERREPDAPDITRAKDGFKGFTIGELTEGITK